MSNRTQGQRTRGGRAKAAAETPASEPQEAVQHARPREGGSFVRDRKAGTLERVEFTEQARSRQGYSNAQEAPAEDPAGDLDPPAVSDASTAQQSGEGQGAGEPQTSADDAGDKQEG